jgi:hypothetical protein
MELEPKFTDSQTSIDPDRGQTTTELIAEKQSETENCRIKC